MRSRRSPNRALTIKTEPDSTRVHPSHADAFLSGRVRWLESPTPGQTVRVRLVHRSSLPYSTVNAHNLHRVVYNFSGEATNNYYIIICDATGTFSATSLCCH